MSRWEKLRLVLLATIFGGVWLVLGKSILYPTLEERTLTPFIFPPSVTLMGWQTLESKPLANQSTNAYQNISGRHYRYLQKNVSLDIEMRYLVKNPQDEEPFGHVSTWIKTYMGMPSFRRIQPAIDSTKGVGFYSLFVHQGKAYLSTCINPYGSSTFTYNQFMRDRYLHDMRLDVLFLWLWGQTQLRDERCLWTQMSVPLGNSSPETAYQTLETAWTSWFKWWSPRFPKR